jgi:hypothetical protein
MEMSNVDVKQIALCTITYRQQGKLKRRGTVSLFLFTQQTTRKQTPWPESARELYRPSDRRLSAKLLPTFADIGVSRSQHLDPLRPNSRFSRPSRYLFFQLAPQFYSRG